MKRKEYLGFTLIELLVTIAVVVILISFGLPKLVSFSADNRLTTQINRLSGDLAYARSTAVQRATDVAITASGGNWSNGWTVAISSSANINPNEKLRVVPALKVDTLTSSTGTVVYSANGALATAATISFKLCGKRTGPYGKELTINPMGRPFLKDHISCP